MSTSYLTDEKILVSLLVQGNETAFRYLYNQHRSWVFTKVYCYLKNSHEAEELVQDIFLEVFQSIHTYRGGCNLKGWIYRIAVNKSINKLRWLKSKKRAATVEFNSELVPNMEMLQQGYHYDEIKHEPTVGYSDLLEIVWTLHPRQQEAFCLCKINKYSYEDAARKMNITIEAVRGLLHRARHSIRLEANKMTSDLAHAC